MELEQEMHEIHQEVTALRSQVTAVKWMIGVLITVAAATSSFFAAALSTHAGIPYHDKAGREIAALGEQTTNLAATDLRLDATIVAGFTRMDTRFDRLSASIDVLREQTYSRPTNGSR